MSKFEIVDANLNNAVDSYKNSSVILKELFDKLDDASDCGDDEDDSLDEVYDELLGYPLCVDEYRIIDICISTGGPATHIEAKLDGNNSILSLSFIFYDWGYRKHFDIDSYSPDWDIYSRFVEMFIIE